VLKKIKTCKIESNVLFTYRLKEKSAEINDPDYAHIEIFSN